MHAIADLQATAHERARGEVADALATAEADAANAEAEVEDLRRELEAMAARKAAVEEERSSPGCLGNCTYGSADTESSPPLTMKMACSSSWRMGSSACDRRPRCAPLR